MGRTARGWKKRVAGAALRAGLGAGLIAGPAMPAAAREEGSLRVATWNTYLLSNVFRCLPQAWDVPASVDCLVTSTSLSGALTPEKIQDQADKIADAILSLKDDVDVIALNEVWDESAKARLVQRLSGTFPNYVSRVDAGYPLPGADELAKLGMPAAAIPGWEGEDSGLMLFAKPGVKFLNMGTATPTPPGGVTGTVPFVRALTYPQASGVDRLAAKGVAAVRVEQTVGGQRAQAYLVFTHMQADADSGAVAARDAQFAQVRRFVARAVIDPADPAPNPMNRVFVLGDLNVQGRGALLPPPPGQAADAEWSKRFVTSAFPGADLPDSWAREASERDLGPTYPRATPVEGDRLDYLLARRGNVAEGYCVQHSRVLLRSERSDHSALVSDLNKFFPFCDPRGAARPAYDKPFQPADGVGTDLTQIAFPGAMQWFRLPKGAATVDVVVPNANVVTRLYDAADMALPIEPVERNVPRGVTTWSVPDDVFVRASGTARTFKGNYDIWFQRRTCFSAESPCYLLPGTSQDAGFGASQPLGAQDAAWFRIDVTEAADSGAAQELAIFARAPKGYDVSLRDAAQPNTVIPTAAAFISGRGHLLSLKLPGTRKMLLRIARDADKTKAATVTAGWNTDLRVVQVTRLVCEDETNGFAGNEAGEDEISLTLTVDGKVRKTPAGGYSNFDCNSYADPQKGFGQTLRALGPVTAQLHEWDDGSPNDPSPVLSFPALPSTRLDDTGSLRFEFEGGDYRLHYALRRGSSGLPPAQ